MRRHECLDMFKAIYEDNIPTKADSRKNITPMKEYSICRDSKADKPDTIS